MRQEQCLEIRLVVAQATRLFRPATRRTAGAVIQANGDGLFATLLAAVPVGGSPTGAGGAPAPPIFKTGSQRFVEAQELLRDPVGSGTIPRNETP